MIFRPSTLLSLANRPRFALPRWRVFTSAAVFHAKPLPPRKPIDDADIEESFLKGTGPGGQKINKTNSAVQLKHLPSGIVVKCQETRSRPQNRKLARRLLQDRLEELELGDASRTAVKRGVALRKKASREKKARRKYRKLEEEKRAASSAVHGEDADAVEVDGSDGLGEGEGVGESEVAINDGGPDALQDRQRLQGGNSFAASQRY